MARPWGAKAWADEVESAAVGEAPAPPSSAAPLPDEAFPSLGEAAKATKKKKATTVSLAEFKTGKYVAKRIGGGGGGGGGGGVFSDDSRLTSEELMMLPTGPKERTEEELNELGAGRLGGGFRDFRGDRDRGDRDRDREQRGFGFDRERESSRADESSDWGANKSSSVRRYDDDRRLSDRDLPSKADEVDNWGATKKFIPSADAGRRSGFGFEDGRGGGGGGISKADAEDNWGATKRFTPSQSYRDSGRESYRDSGRGSDSEKWSFSRRPEELGSDPVGPDADRWSRRGPAEEPRRSERPRLNLQPRTLPVETMSPEKRDENDQVKRLKEEIKLLKEQEDDEAKVAEKEAELEQLCKELNTRAQVTPSPGSPDGGSGSWRRTAEEQEPSTAPAPAAGGAAGGGDWRRGNPWKRETTVAKDPPSTRLDRW